jgi:CRP-like cAMP-binding protein
MFVKKRTENLEINKPQGPTGCSQVRYIKFFERSLHGPVKNRPLVLTKIQIPYIAVSMLHAKSRRESLHKISLHNQMSSDAMELGRKKGSLTDLFSYDCDDPIDESKKKRDAVGESSVRDSSGSLPGPASLSRLRPLLTVCSDQGILFQKTMEYHSGEGLVVDCTMERLLVNEDFRIYVHLARPEPSDSPQKAADKALFFLCTHTGLEKEGSPWVFDKSQLDKCDKDKNHNLFPENFCLKVFYEEVQSPQRYIIFNQDVEINLMKMLTELDHMTTRYGAGEVICHQGSSDTSDLFVVKNGSMRVELIKEGGNAVVLDQDPLMSGEAAFLMGSKRFADIVANEASDVYCLDPEWCHENLSQKDLGTIYLVLCLKIARNLNIANGKLAEQAGRHAVSGRRRRSVESLVDGIKAARTKVR